MISHKRSLTKSKVVASFEASKQAHGWCRFPISSSKVPCTTNIALLTFIVNLIKCDFRSFSTKLWMLYIKSKSPVKLSHLVLALSPSDVPIKKHYFDVERCQSGSRPMTVKLGKLYVKLKISMRQKL